MDIHVTIDANKTAFVLGLAPFETYDDFFVDPIIPRSAHSPAINTITIVMAVTWGREDGGGRTGFAAWAAG